MAANKRVSTNALTDREKQIANRVRSEKSANVNHEALKNEANSLGNSILKRLKRTGYKASDFMNELQRDIYKYDDLLSKLSLVGYDVADYKEYSSMLHEESGNQSQFYSQFKSENDYWDYSFSNKYKGKSVAEIDKVISDNIKKPFFSSPDNQRELKWLTDNRDSFMTTEELKSAIRELESKSSGLSLDKRQTGFDYIAGAIGAGLSGQGDAERQLELKNAKNKAKTAETENSEKLDRYKKLLAQREDVGTDELENMYRDADSHSILDVFRADYTYADYANDKSDKRIFGSEVTSRKNERDLKAIESDNAIYVYTDADGNEQGGKITELLDKYINNQRVLNSGGFGVLSNKFGDENSSIRKVIESKGYDFDSVVDSYERHINAEATEEVTEDVAEYTKDGKLKGVTANIASVGTNILSGVTALPEALRYGLEDLTSDEIVNMDVNSPAWAFKNVTDAIRNTTAENLSNSEYGELTSFLYQTGMSLADMGASYLAGGLNPTAYAMIQSSTVAADKAKEITNNGGSADEALLMGVISGVLEMIFEKIGIDNLIANASSGVTNGLLKTIFNSMLSEGFEELGTDIANSVTDEIINADQSVLKQSIYAYMRDGKSASEAQAAAISDLTKQYVSSFAAGALSGGIIGGAGGSVNIASANSMYKETGANVQSHEGGTDAVMALAREIVAQDQDTDNTISRDLNKVEKKSSAKNVGKLFADVQANLDSQTQTAAKNEAINGIKDRVEELGLDSSTSNKAAEIIYKAYTGENLTARQKSILDKNKYVARAYRELMASESEEGRSNYSNEWTEKVRNNVLKSSAEIRSKALSIEKYNYRNTETKMSAEEEKNKAATISSSGEAVTVNKIVDKTDNGFIAELTNGDEVYIGTDKAASKVTSELDTVSFTNDDMNRAIVYASNYESVETANAFLKAAATVENTETKNTATLQKGFNQVYLQGLRGEKMNTKGLNITAEQANLAYISGTEDAKLSQRAGGGRVDGMNLINTVKENSYSDGVTRLDTEGELTKKQDAQLKVLDAYGKKHGISFVIVDSIGSTAQKTNGAYIGENKIMISLRAEGGALLSVAGHEVYHYIKRNNSADAEAIRAWVIDRLKKDSNYNYDERFKQLSEQYGTEDVEAIEEEITANAMFEVLNNEDTINELANENPSLLKKIIKAIKNFIAELKDLMGSLPWAEAKALQDDVQSLEAIRMLFNQALNNTNKNTAREDGGDGGHVNAENDATKFSIENNDSGKLDYDESKKNDRIKYSYSSIVNTFFDDPDMSTDDLAKANYKSTQGYKNYVEQCVNNLRQTRKDFDEKTVRKEIEKSIEGIVRVAIAAKKAGYDIYDDNKKRNLRDSKNRLLFSSLEPNSEYTTSNDISTICDKSKNFTAIYDEIVKREEKMGVPKGKRFFDNIDNYFMLHKILADKGLTQPCRQCYVDSMRKNLTPMANAFLELIRETDNDNTANPQLFHVSGKNKGQKKANNFKLRERVLEILNEEGISVEEITHELLTTESGLAQLRLEIPMIYEAFNSFYGQSKPKMPKSASPFRFGELTALLTNEKGQINKGLVDKINSTGGFRLQSYSDFQIENYVDILQVLFEAGTLGLSAHAYTKVPAFLDATEGTNLKRNISIFMYKDGNKWLIDKNDSFPQDLERIYEIVDSDKSGNTGIIAVSQNTDMSAWIMANDKIGYGIPFHKSGQKMGTVRSTDVVTEDGRVIKGYKDTIDHTKQQTEVWAESNADHKAKTKVNKPVNIYLFWDFDNKSNLSKNELIEKNVKRYLDACENAGYLPKFRDYVMNNTKVLEDVLNYSKELGSVSQDATVEDISFEYKGHRIPYGYYKFLIDFSVFTPDGKASSHSVVTLADYNFDKAEAFFADDSIRRNEILQQFANGEEREKYRSSNLTSEELEAEIKKKRNEVAEYIVNKRNDVGNGIKFSLQETAQAGATREQLLKENDNLRVANNVLRNELKLTKGKTISMIDAQSLARHMIREFSSDYDSQVLAKKLYDIFRWYDSEDGNADYVVDYIATVAKDVIARSSARDTSLYDEYEDARKWIRNMRFTLPEHVFRQLNENHNGKFRQKTFGKMQLVSKEKNPDVMYLSAMYSELADAYPNFFSTEDNEYEQPQKLLDFWEAVTPTYADVTKEMGFEYEEAAAVGFAYMTFEKYLDMPSHQTFADRKQKEIDSLKKEYSRNLNETKKKLREERDAKVEETKQYYRDMIDRQRVRRMETQAKAALRKDVITKVKKLSDMLTKPTDKKHIPDQLKNMVAKYLMLFTDDSAVFSEAVINRVTKAYTQLIEEDDGAMEGIRQYYDPDILIKLGRLAEIAEAITDGNRLAKLDAFDMNTIAEITDHFYHLVTNANEVFIGEKKKDFNDIITSVMGELHSQKSKAVRASFEATSWNMTPYYFFKKIGGMFNELFTDLLDGQHKYGLLMDQAREHMQELGEKYKISSWQGSKKAIIEFIAGNGEEVKLTADEALGIYAIAKRESISGQESKHLTEGGIVFKGKEAIPVLYEEITRITNALTKEQLAYADEAIEYLSTVVGGWGNEASLKMFGYKKFDESWYYPFHTAENYRRGESSEDGKTPEIVSLIKNKSFTKSTVHGANTPVRVENFTDVVGNHIAEMISYNTMAQTQSTLNAVFKYNVGNNSVRAALEDAYGTQAKSYVDTLIKDITNGPTRDPNEKFADKMISRFKMNAVAANLSVIVQQPSAVGRAFAHVDPKYFFTKSPKNGYEECKKYSGVAVIKEIGGFDTSTGKGNADWIMKTDPDGIKNKAVALVKDSDYRNDKLSWAAGKADELTWALIWQAVKGETADKLNVKVKDLTEEQLIEAGKRFNQVIEATQVYDSVLTRSQFMRGKSSWTKMASAFMAEPTKRINMLYDAFYEFTVNKNKDSGKYLMRTMGSVLAATVINVTLKSLITAGRDDDENQAYAEKYVEAVIDNAFSELSILQGLPIIKDIVSLMQGYDITRTDMEIVSTAVSALESFANLDSDKLALLSDEEKKERITKAIENTVSALGAFIGLPIHNVWRDCNMLIRVGKSVADDKVPTSSGMKYSALDGLINAFYTKIGSPFEELKVNEKDLYKNMVNDDEAAFAENWDKYQAYLIYTGKTEDKAYKAVKSKVKEQIKINLFRNKLTDEEAERYLIEYLGNEDGYWVVKEWRFNAIEENKDISFSKYLELEKAVLAGEDITDKVKELTDHNTKESSVQSKVTSIIQDAFNNDEITEGRAQELLQLYKGFASKQSMSSNILDEDKDINRLVDSWVGNKDLPEGEYYTAFDDLEEAVIEDMSIENAKEKLYSLEYTDSDINQKIRDAVKEAMLDGTLTKAEASSRLMKYTDIEYEDAQDKIAFWNFQKTNPESKLSETGAVKYLEAKESGVSLEVFEDYYSKVTTLTSDKDANGKTITGSKKVKILRLIDSLPLSSKQKDVLYYQNGYSSSRLYEAPWH